MPFHLNQINRSRANRNRITCRSGSDHKLCPYKVSKLVYAHPGCFLIFPDLPNMTEWFRIRSKLNNLVLDVLSNNSRPGATVSVWHSHGGRNQTFRYDSSSKLIFCQMNGYCLDAVGKRLMLTHWGRDKMAAVSQTTFSNAFSWLKILEFRLRFHWSLFLRVQLTIIRIGSDNGLAPVRRQAIMWTNDG